MTLAGGNVCVYRQCPGQEKDHSAIRYYFRGGQYAGYSGVHVYVPKAGRGTSTNPVGFFSMPVLVGDSVVVSAVGYVRKSFLVPNYPEEFYDHGYRDG